MSKLKQKSLFNIESAELLISNNLYCSSVHCSYYSCLQLLKFTIKDFFKIDYSVLDTKIISGNLGSHQFIINFVMNEIKSNVGRHEARNFKRSIMDLKQFRTQSDYENIEVNITQGQKAFELANEVRAFLTKIFHV